MVFVLDVNSEHVAHTLEISLFGETPGFVTDLDLIKCLKQIE